MDISGKRMYDTLKELNFVRLSTTDGETKAAQIICDKIKEMGIDAQIETFKVPTYNIKKVSLQALEPFSKTYEVTGYGYSGNDAKDTIEAELAYIEGFDELSLMNVKGKIVLISSNISSDQFELLIKAGAVAFIGISGFFLDKKGSYDVEERMLRERQLKKGVIPGVCIHINDALSLVENNVTKVRLTLEQEQFEADSRNVVAEVKGTMYPDEVVVFTSHFDSVVFSHGMFDNGSGTVNNLELLRHYVKNPPKRTVKFVFTGSEERGLFGSKAYVRDHESELQNIKLCVNVDMTGVVLGRDYARVTGEETIVHSIDFFAKTIGHGITAYQDIYSSDGIPFADVGIPAINFYRSAINGLTQIHCRNDVISRMNPKALASTCIFIEKYMDVVLNSVVFPYARKMPDNMVEKVNKYLGK